MLPCDLNNKKNFKTDKENIDTKNRIKLTCVWGDGSVYKARRAKGWESEFDTRTHTNACIHRTSYL